MKKNITPLRIDLTPIIGFVGLILFFCASFNTENSLQLGVCLSALLCILGCALCVLVICFSPHQILSSFAKALKNLCILPESEKSVALAIMQASKLAHNSSLLSLQKTYMQEYTFMPFWQDCLSLLIDGMPADQSRQIMQNKMITQNENILADASVLEKFANILLIIGAIETVFLFTYFDVHNLLFTLPPVICGAVLSFIIFRPLALRTKLTAARILKNENLCLIGLNAVECGQNPRKTQIELNALLSPSNQIHYLEE